MSYGLDVTADGSLLVAGYTRSNTVHFGTSNVTVRSRASGFTNYASLVAKLSATESMPPCLSSCSATGQISVLPGFCYVNGICVAHGATSPFQPCFACDANANNLGWTGPDLSLIHI